MSTPRRSTAARGYGGSHAKERKKWEPIVRAGRAICARCGKPIHPAAPFDLDHAEDRRYYIGVSHMACNRRAAAHKTNAIRRARSKTRRARTVEVTSITW